MLSGKKKLQLASAFAALLLFAAGVGCNGFFVDPTLTSVTVGPQATIQQGKTVQMSAVGTYNDGTQKTISNVFWSTSASSVATISSGGLVTGVSPGQATISGAAGTVSGSNTVTVTLANLTSIKIDPISKTIIAGNSQAYTATGIANGKQVNLNGAGELNWTIDNMDNNLINIDNTGVVTTDTSISSPQLVHVQAQDPTTGLTSNTATLQVNNQ
jgi:hypothetical protein